MEEDSGGRRRLVVEVSGGRYRMSAEVGSRGQWRSVGEVDRGW